MLCQSRAATMTTLLKAALLLSRRILAGNELGVLLVAPLPSCPTSFRPHCQTVPSEPSAAECQSPPDTATMLLSAVICTGFVRLTVLPSPTSPCPLSPHAKTV